ncbi:hypothetical protein BKA70DRAFT_1049467, partial [Coprinopsis sp. MPI-PUGE-AT-0042]
STLETVLLTNVCDDYTFVKNFFFHWPVSSILALGRSSILLYGITRAYREHAWDVNGFLELWFSRPQRVRSLMANSGVLISGPAVLDFFCRRADGQGSLMVWTTLSRLGDVVSEINQDNYVFVNATGARPGPWTAALRELCQDWAARPYRTGERSDDHALHQPIGIYNFRKPYRSPCGGVVHRSVDIAVTTCEPYRGILAQTSTALTCYIDWNAAVCPFARSTLDTLRSFVIYRAALSGSSDRLAEFHELVAGPPRNEAVYPEISTGSRYLGDRDCWVVPYTNGLCLIQYGMGCGARYRSQCFEVFDHTSGLVSSPSYLRIGEPSIL